MIKDIVFAAKYAVKSSLILILAGLLIVVGFELVNWIVK